MTNPTVTFEATAKHMAALTEAFIRDWIDSPEWVERWVQEFADIGTQRPMASNRVASDPDAVLRRLHELRNDGSWDGIDYGHQSRENWDAVRHFTLGLQPLTVAYASPVSPLHRDERLRTALIRGIDFWLSGDFRNPNWWYQHIGLPGYLFGPTLLVMREHLSKEQRDKATDILSRCDLKRHEHWRTGGNCLFDCRAGLVFSLFTGDAELVSRIYSRMLYKELHVTPPEGSGVKEDFSHWEHGNLLFNHGYGALLLTEGGRLLALARQASIPVHEPTLAFLSDYLLNGCQWMVRGLFLDFAADGRAVASPASSKGNGTTAAGSATYLAVGARYLLRAGTPRRAEIETLINREHGQAPALAGNRMFHISDFMTHHRPAFYLSIRNFSTRTINTEICNLANRLGHHLGEGSIYLVRRGDEYDGIFPVWDWNKVPGTTTNLSALDDAAVDENPDSGWFPCLNPEDEGYGRARLRVSRIGRSDFVGGVSDGSVGVTCLDLKVLSLRARKSFFCMDDGLMCLGSGITDTQPAPVVTTVNQCRLKGEVHVIEANGQMRKLRTGTHALPGARLVWHDGVAYVFAPNQRVVCVKQPQLGHWKRLNFNQSDTLLKMDVFTLWLEHGSCPSDASYAYRIIPGVTLAQAEKLWQDESVKVLSLTASLQAVRDSRSGMIGAVFYKPGVLWLTNGLNVHVSHPCAIMLFEKEGKLFVSDPTQATRTINIGVHGTTHMHFAHVEGGRTTGMALTGTLMGDPECPIIHIIK
jgi:chondroitin AC lyase